VYDLEVNRFHCTTNKRLFIHQTYSCN